MFSYEIDQLIRSKGNVITRNDYFKLDPLLSPQITHIHYDAYTGHHQIYTDDGYSWDFEITKD